MYQLMQVCYFMLISSIHWKSVQSILNFIYLCVCVCVRVSGYQCILAAAGVTAYVCKRMCIMSIDASVFLCACMCMCILFLNLGENRNYYHYASQWTPAQANLPIPRYLIL